MATENKYDRQLRLWGKSGQIALAQTNVAVLGSGPTATETLKNLVLPGIGAFTVVDDATVTEEDLGNNFFLEASDLGKSRAAAVTALLVEMNPADCRGSSRSASVSELVRNEPEYFKTFSLIIATQLTQPTLLALAEICWENNIPLVNIRTCGMIGSLRLQLRNHEIVESKPDTEFFDLRISDPFPALDAHCLTYNLSTMSDKDHSHVPYVVLLVHAAREWRASHGGSLPKNFAEKKEFKQHVKAMGRDLREQQLNFKEALANAHRVYAPMQLSPELQECISACRAATLTSESTEFQFMVKALIDFMDNEGQGLPPLSGTIPDMEADNPKYIGLQHVYETKAAEDIQAVARRLQEILTAHGRPADAISQEKLVVFCRNAWNLRTVQTRSVADELASPRLDLDLVFEMSQEELFTQAPILWYIGLRGVDRFQMANGRYPGAPGGPPGSLESDAAKVWDETQGFLRENGVEVEQMTQAITDELVRYGGQEVHNTAAVMGGVASQEAIKVITHQWTPANSTFIFNGVAGCAQTMEV